MRARASASATREVSMVIQRRPHCSATVAVVPEPHVGSSTEEGHDPGTDAPPQGRNLDRDRQGHPLAEPQHPRLHQRHPEQEDEPDRRIQPKRGWLADAPNPQGEAPPTYT